MSFSKKIISWYLTHKRELPWRNTKDPYKIWLSEIILQQTRVEQGLPYYYKFTEKFHDIFSLAKADEEKILKLWQGLGYYSRARNMHTAAKEIVEKNKGIFPNTYEQILELKGIGEYTAAAIASFAFNLPFAVVDGNVYRLLSRYFGIETPIDSGKGKKEFFSIANELLDKSSPATFNQAIMEFGARQCKPANPLCPDCPLSADCYALKNNMTALLPVKTKTLKVKERHFHYLVLNSRKGFYLKKRTENDIWKNLYDFPMLETTNYIEEDKLFQSEEWKKKLKNEKWLLTKVSEVFKHQLSHRKLYAKFYEINVEPSLAAELAAEYIFVNKEKLKTLGIPKLIENYLRSKENSSY